MGLDQTYSNIIYIKGGHYDYEYIFGYFKFYSGDGGLFDCTGRYYIYFEYDYHEFKQMRRDAQQDSRKEGVSHGRTTSDRYRPISEASLRRHVESRRCASEWLVDARFSRSSV